VDDEFLFIKDGLIILWEHRIAEILGDPYSKKSPLPSIGNIPHLANSPKLSSYQVLGQSRIQQRHITYYNHPRIEAQ
jgi:hypothetical protein